MERKILSAALNSRQAFEKITELMSDNEFSDQGNILYQKIRDFYDTDSAAEYVDKDILCAIFDREYPKHAKTFKDIIRTLEEVISPLNLVKEIKAQKQFSLKQEIANLLIADKEEEALLKIDELTSIMENSTSTTEDNKEILEAPDVEFLTTAYHRDNLIQLYPKSLNEKVDGGVLKQQHILIFARPEVGKSMFSINMACGFAVQGLKTLYIINEDPVVSIAMRAVSRLSGMTKAQIISNPQEASTTAREKGYNNLIFSSLSPGSPREIEGLIKKYKPDCVIVDQIRNLKGAGDGLVHSLENNAIAMRAIAKRNNVLVVSVTQAGDSASNKLVLEMSDVDSSKTGLPAQIDLMIGVGVNDIFKSNNQRMLSLCKNKISGVHEYFPVSVDETLSKVGSI